VERLGHVEAIAVSSSVLVSVQVLLGFPLGSVPKLVVGSVASRELVGGDFLELELGAVLETKLGVAGSPVGFSLGSGAVVTGSLRGGVVVMGVVVRMVFDHGGATVSARGGLQGLVSAGDQSFVESGYEINVSYS